MLEEDDIEIVAISGSSAGAMNGAALKSGWLAGLLPDATDLMQTAPEYSLPFSIADTMARMSSPYALGPFYQNPLRPIAVAFEYDKVCAKAGRGATDVFLESLSDDLGKCSSIDLEEMFL